MPRVRRAMAPTSVGEAARRRGDERAEEPEDALGVVGVAVLAGERGEAQQRDGGGRVGRRGGVVEEILLAHDQSLAVVGAW